jgi:hypothetical protein
MKSDRGRRLAHRADLDPGPAVVPTPEVAIMDILTGITITVPSGASVGEVALEGGMAAVGEATAATAGQAAGADAAHASGWSAGCCAT